MNKEETINKEEIVPMRRFESFPFDVVLLFIALFVQFYVVTTWVSAIFS